MTTHEQLPRNCTQLARCSQRRQGAPGIGRARRCRAMSTLTALTSSEYNSLLHPYLTRHAGGREYSLTSCAPLCIRCT
jgi:hypothetical protein